MVGVDINVDALVARMNALEKRHLPQITLRALNDAAFEVRQEWAEVMPKVFDRPTQLTLKAPLYRKATPQKLIAEVFIRDDATKGTPPASYLGPQVFAGPRTQKRGEAALARATGFPKFFVPGKSMKLDQYGNIPRGIMGKILSQLQASPDATQRETSKRRLARLKRQRKRGGGGSYFTVPVKRGGLRPGVVYERISTAFGSSVRTVLFGLDQAPTYKKRYDVFGLAQKIFARRFAANFQTRLSLATRGRL